MLKLWILHPLDDLPEDTNPWRPWYDRTFGFVICALSEDDARALAGADAGAEGDDAWTNPTLSTCEELTADDEPGVVMRDFARA